MALVTNNIIDRVFKIEFNEYSASSFTFEQNNVQYLITARHLFKPEFPTRGKIKIQERSGKIISKEVNIYYSFENMIDIAVLKIIDDYQLLPQHPVSYHKNGYKYSDDVYFLGFPFGMQLEMKNSKVNIPLVKKGIISGFKDIGNIQLIYVDGINNPGFSGGPVFTIDDKFNVDIIGIVSGYRFNKENIVDSSDKIIEQLFYKENTGIIYVYSMIHVFEIIKTIHI